MSEQDFFREIREDIKKSTNQMLHQKQPSPDLKPLHHASLATDCSEIDPGFEFSTKNSKSKKIENVNTVEKSSKKNKPVRNNVKREVEIDADGLAKDILSKLQTVKDKLKAKKYQCYELDGVQGSSVVSKGDNTRAESNERKATKACPDAKNEFDEKANAMKKKIQEIQDKIKNLNMVTDNEPKSRSDASSISSTTKPKQKRKQDSTNKPNLPRKGADDPPTYLNKPENLLLLTLLSLSSKQRDDYLIKIGKERALLSEIHTRKKTNTGVSLEVNPKYASFANDLKNAALVHCYGSTAKEQDKIEDIARPFLTIDKAKKIQDVKKVPEARTFEDAVSYLLNNGKTTDRKDYKKELTLENVSKIANNGYLTEPNKAALAELVDRLVRDDVGYIVEGAIRINQNNNAQAFVNDSTREGNIFINSITLRKCAMDGDFVKVFVKHPEPEPEVEGPKPTTSAEDNKSVEENDTRIQNNRGFVIEILEKRHSRLCVGTFIFSSDKIGQYIIFAPRDNRIPCMRVFKQNLPEAVLTCAPKEIASVIYQAEIIEWHNDIPIANILKSIGKSGELEVENQAILVEYDLDVTPYSEEILNTLPEPGFQIPVEEIAKREDLRDECVFTIDPLTARDLDDALSCKILKNGNYEIGVHISDVSYFLREGSELDEQVKLRATSIYMVDGVYHMLPKPLCFLCSLLPGEDKLAFSVFWEITPNAKVLNTRFAKTVINSCTQLAYEHAQIMLDKPNEDLKAEDFPVIRNGYSPNYLSKIVNQLQTIAVQLRACRMANGCLKMNQPKLSFTLDPNTGKPTNYSIYQLRTANQMIEDFMLLANASVAEFTLTKFPSTSVLRNHFPPEDHQMKNLRHLLSKHGHKLRHESAKAIADSFETIANSCADPDAARAVLNIMIAKPMTRARYFCSAFASSPEDFRHFALAIPMYTHFTSPIRRYADCLAHRVLGAALEVDVNPERTPEELSKLTEICNIKKYNAKLAGEASSLLYFKHYMKQVKSLDTEAAISEIGQQQIELVLIHTGHVIKVSYKQLSKSAQFKIVEDTKPIRQCILISKENFPPTTVKLFSKVGVRLQLTKDTLTICRIVPLETVKQPTAATNDSQSGSLDADSIKTNSSNLTV